MRLPLRSIAEDENFGNLSQEATVKKFLQRFRDIVIGFLCGWDRIRFQGSRRWLAGEMGFKHYLDLAHILRVDFREHALETTDRLCQDVEQREIQQGREVHYLPSSKTDKDETVRAFIAEHGITQGLVGVWSCVESCRTVGIHGKRQTQKLHVQFEQSRCLHYYHYYLDERFGLMHTRLQSWYPFHMQICMNGREWLARQMDEAGIDYLRKDNCFVRVADLAKAQELLTAQVNANWPVLLEELARRSNPLEQTLLPVRVPYYWAVQQSEWAADVLFQSQEQLQSVYPLLVRHAMEHFHSRDVLRFLGHRTTAKGTGIYANYAGEASSHLKERPEGVRVRHSAANGDCKMYDKEGELLRPEVTVTEVAGFWVERTKEGDEQGKKARRPLRKGVVDMALRAEVSQQIADRYLDALASVTVSQTLAELTQRTCQPVQWHGRRARGLRPLSEDDDALLEAVSRGDWIIAGFRNKDIRALLYPANPEASPADNRRQASAVTRKIRLLRAHGLIEKQEGRNSYQVTHNGRKIITAIQAARRADAEKLTQAA
jgi:hypothetical protein